MRTVWRNGKRVEPDDLGLDVSSPWLRFGDAIFETVRIDRGRPLWWSLHRDRILAAAVASGVDTDSLAERVDFDVFGCIEMSGLIDGALRLYVASRDEGSRAVDVVVIAEQWEPPVDVYRRGVTLALTDVPHPRDGAFGKSAARRWARIARRRAPADVDDVIFMVDGACAETSTASLIWRRHGRWCTPPPELGMLRSTTVAALQRCGLDVEHERLSPGETDDVEAMVVVSSLRLAVGVRRFIDFVDEQPDRHAMSLRALLLDGREL